MQAFPVRGLPLLQPGDDLPRLLARRVKFQGGDILAVSSTAVSKVEGRIVPLDSLRPGPRARAIARRHGEDPRFVEAVLRESVEVLMEEPTLLVRDRRGHIAPNAGIDRSNIPPGLLLLSPRDPDGSARRIRRSLQARTGRRIAVIVTDTCGRPFRIGQTGVALGVAGLRPLLDWRGTRDLYGNLMEVKHEAVADELAGFANLLMGETLQGTPAAVLRGLRLPNGPGDARKLHRPLREDMVRHALLRARRR
ncbi:MAG: coenzyme F420-0:L-glutamate ligase [Euryarchaeota archaeon]|nr:coenzyme F420-0:L-glutamate ligase [Euryarchaeota archaeon]